MQGNNRAEGKQINFRAEGNQINHRVEGKQINNRAEGKQFWVGKNLSVHAYDTYVSYGLIHTYTFHRRVADVVIHCAEDEAEFDHLQGNGNGPVENCARQLIGIQHA